MRKIISIMLGCKLSPMSPSAARYSSRTAEVLHSARSIARCRHGVDLRVSQRLYHTHTLTPTRVLSSLSASKCVRKQTNLTTRTRSFCFESSHENAVHDQATSINSNKYVRTRRIETTSIICAHKRRYTKYTIDTNTVSETHKRTARDLGPETPGASDNEWNAEELAELNGSADAGTKDSDSAHEGGVKEVDDLDHDTHDDVLTDGEGTELTAEEREALYLMKPTKRVIRTRNGFVDTMRVRVRAGKGGNGCMSFHREKFLERGGPDGGDGGRGGDVIVVASDTINSFNKMKAFCKADSGVHGKGATMHGATGADAHIVVPVGTVVYSDEAKQLDPEAGSELIADLTKHGQSQVLVRGGAGGLGNVHFANSKNKAPRQTTEGKPPQEKILRFEIKTFADAGLVGLPNAGKSSFLSAITAARPEVASYPFTTLNPHVGVLHYDDCHALTVADIPGIIKGAHANFGLGHAFLRHVERARVLVYVVDCAGVDGRDPVEDLAVLQRELTLYKEGMVERPSLVIANKMDHPAFAANYERLVASCEHEVVAISAMTKENIKRCTKRLRQLIEKNFGPLQYSADAWR